ncbi:MAG: hypothetical protein U0872_05435 [Planctomycetaceae bacterium]
MSATGAGLKQLHELLLQLRDVQSQLESGPRQIAARRQIQEKKQAELEAKRQKLKQLKMTADQKNLLLKANETKIADLRAKQNSVTSNREYDILRGQIDADQMAKSVLEDEILESLEAVDRGQVEVKQFEQEVDAAERDLKNFVAEIEQRIPGLKEQAEALQTQVIDAEKFLPGDIAGNYRRLVQVHGADALAAVENRSCSNCYLSLTQQMIVELNSGKLLFCKSCQRLLYLPSGRA